MAAGVTSWRITRDPCTCTRTTLVDGCYELVVASAEELIVENPFDIRLCVRDITP